MTETERRDKRAHDMYLLASLERVVAMAVPMRSAQKRYYRSRALEVAHPEDTALKVIARKALRYARRHERKVDAQLAVVVPLLYAAQLQRKRDREGPTLYNQGAAQ